MKDVADLLDAIKERQSLETDSALAKALGVSRQTVNNWRQGRNTPDAVACATIAGLTGEPLAKVIGIAGEQRAISREEKAVWRKLAATAALLVVMVTGGAYTPAQAATGYEKADSVCIMRNCVRDLVAGKTTQSRLFSPVVAALRCTVFRSALSRSSFSLSFSSIPRSRGW